MKEYLPYIVSILTAALSFFGSLLITKRSNKADIEKMKLEHEQIMERNKQEQEARIAQLEKEYALKMGTQVVTDLTNKAVGAVLESNAVQTEINKQALKSIATKSSKKRGKHK